MSKVPEPQHGGIVRRQWHIGCKEVGDVREYEDAATLDRFMRPQSAEERAFWPSSTDNHDQSSYLVLSPDLNRVKIGRSCKPMARTRDLNQQAPAPLYLLGWIAGNFERFLHHRFASERVHGEWFNLHGRLRCFAESAFSLASCLLRLPGGYAHSTHANLTASVPGGEVVNVDFFDDGTILLNGERLPATSWRLSLDGNTIAAHNEAWSGTTRATPTRVRP